MLPLPGLVGSRSLLTVRGLRPLESLHTFSRVGSHGDHVAGTPEEARVPGTSSARTARSFSISPSVSAAASGALLGTPASRGGLARSAANSRRVSRESKLKEHGDV